MAEKDPTAEIEVEISVAWHATDAVVEGYWYAAASVPGTGTGVEYDGTGPSPAAALSELATQLYFELIALREAAKPDAVPEGTE